MKKLVLALSVISALSLCSCIGEGKIDSQDVVPEDSTLVDNDAQAQREVSGVAIDGAMNSVYLKVGDDTIGFSYPNLDSDHRAAWDVGDSITVRYYVTQDGDSVTDVINRGDIS